MKLIMRKAEVGWKSGPRGGTKVLSTRSGVLKKARFSSGGPLKNNADVDPAELIAAAHAGSYSLALSKELGLAGYVLGSTVTTATVTMERLPVGWMIMNIHLNVLADLPKVSQADFIDAIVRAKTNCMVSRLLRANTSMNAKLEKGRAVLS